MTRTANLQNSNFEREILCLRYFGDTLQPDSISEALGSSPTKSWRKGELWSDKGVGALRETGAWVLNADWTGRLALNDQIESLFESLSTDTAVWRKLAQEHHADVFCGFFLGGDSGYSALPLETLESLSSRRLAVHFGVYDGV